MASVSAKPSSVYVNNWRSNDGLRAMAVTRDAKTNPTPTPAPLIEIVANPAPMSFALSNAIFIFRFSLLPPACLRFSIWSHKNSG